MPHPDMRLAVDKDGTPRLVQYFSLCGVWAVTPYSACDLRCSYCITFSQGNSTPRLTANIGDAVLREVRDLPPDALLALGGLVDAYPRAEDEFGVTRELLQALAISARPVIIITKGPTVTRDIDFILAGNMRVCVSISSLNDALLKSIEPYVAPASERMSAIEELWKAGVDVCLQAQPWIPGVTDAQAIIEWADGRFPVSFTPLNVDSPGVVRTRLGKRFTQREINRAYLEERERLGKRRLVTWHKPLWVGTSELQPLSLESPALETPTLDTPVGTDAERRNLAAIRYFLGAFKEEAQYEALLGFISPYVRGTDNTGHATDKNHPDSGRTYDLLYALYKALDAPEFQVIRLAASGNAVDLQLVVSGIFTTPLFDIAPSGRFVTVPVEYRYIFDSQGLVLEFTQCADLNNLAEPPYPMSASPLRTA